MYIDTHTHFDLCIHDGETEKNLIEGLQKNKISYAVQVSIDTNGLQWSYNFAKKNKFPVILFTMGIHPSSTADREKLSALSGFVKNIMESKDSNLVFGIGETGLDYYRMRQPMKEQIRSFEHQLKLAKEWNLPVIVHSRDAMDDTLGILKNSMPEKGIMHCFSGNSEEARPFLDLGFYISFAGNVTYSKAAKLHEAASYIPLDRLLLETDAPFLTPVPHRGKKNVPHYVTHTYEFIARLRNVNSSILNEKIMENFLRIANL